MARRQVPVEYAAKPFPTVRYLWRRLVRDPWLHRWQTRIIPQYRDEPIIKNSRLNRLYYDLKGSYIGEVPEHERAGIRRGILDGLMNNDADVNEYAQGVVKDILTGNLRRIGVNGQNLNGRATNLSEMNLEQIYQLYNRIEQASEVSNRMMPQANGNYTIDPDYGEVLVDANGVVDGYGTPTATGALPGAVRPVFLEAVHFLDRGNFDTSRGSELARSLFTSKTVTDIIERYWKHGGQNLAQTLTAKRGAIKAALTKAIMPDAMSNEELPTGVNGKKLELAVRMANALGAGPTDASHYFWMIHNNVPHNMLWELGKQIRRMEQFKTTWPDYYFKPQGWGPDMTERRDDARRIVFRQLLEQNLDVNDPNKLKKQIRHITARMQYPTEVREGRIMQLAYEVQRLHLLRELVQSATAEETAHVLGKRAGRFGISQQQAQEGMLARIAAGNESGEASDSQTQAKAA